MLSFLKNHPFAVEAFFNYSLVLTYAVDVAEIQKLLPECLQPDTFDNKWAFVAAAMVQTKALRPKGFPAFLGSDFFLTGYRIFVRHTTNTGKNRRGLYILRSQTDSKRMEVMGNLFTHYNYSTIKIDQHFDGAILEINSGNEMNVKVSLSDAQIGLPADSPFATWQEARRFAGPLPFTFTHDAEKNEILTVEGVRESWIPMPVKVEHASFSFIDSLGFKNITLANAFIIKDIPYYWKKGTVEKWLRK